VSASQIARTQRNAQTQKAHGEAHRPRDVIGETSFSHRNAKSVMSQYNFCLYQLKVNLVMKEIERNLNALK